MTQNKSFSKNFLILFSGNGIGQLLPILFAPILGRLFTEEDIAVQTNFLAIVGLISIISGGRYEKAFVLPADKSKAMNLFGLASRITIVLSVLSLGFYFFRNELDALYDDGKMADYMIFVFVAVPIYGFTNILNDWLVKAGLYKSITTSGIARSAFVSLFSVLFGYLSFGASGLIFGALIGMFVAVIMMFISARDSLDFSLISKSGMRDVAGEYKDFPLINSAHAFTDILFGQFILYLVMTREYGLAEFGLFAMMTKYLGASMKSVGNSVGQLYYKEASDLHAAGKIVQPVFFRSVKLVLLFAVPLLILILLAGPVLFEWYLGPRFYESGVIAQIMIFPMFINFVVSPVSGTPLIYRKQGMAFAFSLVAYIAGIGVIMWGSIAGLEFYNTLKLYAAVQALYYIWLFIWYYSLTRSSR